MATLKKSVFSLTALASGLVTKTDLDEATAKLRAESPASPGKEVDDEQLAAKLVELGKINKWQAGQLLAGLTKFTLNHYQIVDSIGKGGMAEVFLAEHPIMGRRVAIKVLPRDRTNPESIANFRREIKAQAQLSHENLVVAHDAGHDGKRHFLVTEYVPGADLRKHIKKHGKLGMKAAAAIICQAAAGLDYAHKRGLIHRDVKPGNLLIANDGTTKLSDLGLAGFFNSETEEAVDPHEGKIVGTADFLAPEQIESPEVKSPVSDIYSLGCTLYYAVTGKVPFPGGNAKEKARKHCREQPFDPRILNADLTDPFVEVMAQLMHKDPKQRVATAADAVRLLSPFAGANWKESAKEVGVLFQSSPSRSGRMPVVSNYNPQELDDTRPVLENGDDDLQAENSQTSQVTYPVASAGEETSWLSDIRPKLTDSGFSTGVLVMVVAGVCCALAVLVAMVFNSMSR